LRCRADALARARAAQNSNVGSYTRQGFVEVLAAQQSPENPDWFQGTADAVRQYLWLFKARFCIVPCCRACRACLPACWRAAGGAAGLTRFAVARSRRLGAAPRLGLPRSRKRRCGRRGGHA
jgi:hypothetical protein